MEKQQSLQKVHISSQRLHRGLCNTVTDSREVVNVCCVSSGSLWTTSSCYKTSGGTRTRCPAISLTRAWWHLSISLTPSLFSQEMAAFFFFFPSRRRSAPGCRAAPRRRREAEMPANTEMAHSVPLTSKKLKERCCRAAESERRMMDGSKQSNSVALLYGRRTNICQGWMMCVASAPIIRCAGFSHVAFFLRRYCRCRERERERDR